MQAGGPRREGGPGGDNEPTVAVGGERLAADRLLEIARGQVSGYEITRVQLPQRPEQAFRASYSLPTGFAANRTLFLDPYTGKVLESAAPQADYNAVVRGLHFGNFAGVPMKLIYTVTGLMPLGLFITGLWMWARKKAAQARGRAARSQREALATVPEESIAVS